MSTRDPLEELAALICEKNVVDGKIAAITGRPTQLGHVGEYIASQVFDIELHENAREKGSDGLFLSGPLQSHCVDVKWYTKQEWILDIKRDKLPDYFLVFTHGVCNEINSRKEGRTKPP